MTNRDVEFIAEAYLKIQRKQDIPLEEFIQKRKDGAADIQARAEKKGGSALLTVVHFAAKEKPYKQALKACKADNCADVVKEQADTIVERLQNWHSLSQQQFQHLMGQLEAYGEVYLQAK